MLVKKLINKLLGRKKTKLKKSLSISQKDNSIMIEGELSNPNYLVKELWLVSRNSGDVVKAAMAKQPSSVFRFNIDLSHPIEAFTAESDIYDAYLYVSIAKENLSEKAIERLKDKANIVTNEDSEIKFEYPIRLGRFAETITVNPNFININDNKITLFKTNKGNVSFAVNYELTARTKTQINELKLKKSKVNIKGKLFTKSSEIKSCCLIFKGRETNLEAKVPVEYELLQEETKRRFGLNRYRFKIQIDLNRLFENRSLDEDIYDAFLEIQYHDIEGLTRARLGRPRFKAKFNLKSAFAKRDDETLAVSPYYTIKYSNLSFQVDKFDSEPYRYLRKMMRWYWIYRLLYVKKDIWIVGERPYKAQDTGFHFFKYMRENHPDKNVYYVIEEDSPELKNIKEYGNILYYKSKQHIFHVLMATRIIGSHHPDYLYPLRTDEFKRKVKAAKVFLQHGVMGTKNTVHFYSKRSSSFDTDLFLVSSDFEKNIIVRDFGYEPHEVNVTGLSRFDKLLLNDVPLKRQLLIIPTWREWLVNDDIFLESEYFQRYKSLVNNPRLHQLSQEYDFKIVFCLHPNMQQFTPYFKDSPVRVISQGEVDVQHLMKESAIMITDYSSVAFDFSFLERPIIYYQFDRKRFIGKKGSHLNLDEDLPGDIAFEEMDILENLEKYAKNDFVMNDINRKRAAKFLKYKDLNSSQRIYHSIEKVRKKSVYKSAIESELANKLFMRFRKSQYYFPTMKLFYNIARRVLPVDQKLIVFESGVGKQYADSPRYIYEEILKRQLDYRKIWFCNRNIKFDDIDTKRVQRLSPKYYYYLARAKYWVNNQNFPTYIKKRPQTIYLQTWHGTPLKKMLYDIEEVHGRSDDYVERVGNAVKNWDFLVSPSPYATQAFRSAFRYNGKVLETGYPRNDIFYKSEKDEIARNVRKKLNIEAGKKVILYAPTFRDDQVSNKNKFIFDIHMDFHRMKEELGDEYVILLRMHVLISNKINIEESLSDFVYNVSSYSDIQELYLITDILITDYSSVMFDFANTGRPILFYTFDIESYRNNLRGFYIDFENEAPGPCITDTDQVIDCLKNIKEIEVEYKEKYKLFQEKYCPLEDGLASKRIVEELF